MDICFAICCRSAELGPFASRHWRCLLGVQPRHSGATDAPERLLSSRSMSKDADCQAGKLTACIPWDGPCTATRSSHLSFGHSPWVDFLLEQTSSRLSAGLFAEALLLTSRSCRRVPHVQIAGKWRSSHDSDQRAHHSTSAQEASKIAQIIRTQACVSDRAPGSRLLQQIRNQIAASARGCRKRLLTECWTVGADMQII